MEHSKDCNVLNNVCFFSNVSDEMCQKKIFIDYLKKHRENCKTLPFKHCIGCQCVKLSLLKDVTITTFTTVTITTVTITTVTITTVTIIIILVTKFYLQPLSYKILVTKF